MSGAQIVEVNAQAVDAEGNDYNYRVQPHILAAGLMIEMPVTLRFPDGRTAAGMKPMFTVKGLEYARDAYAADQAGHGSGTA